MRADATRLDMNAGESCTAERVEYAEKSLLGIVGMLNGNGCTLSSLCAVRACGPRVDHVSPEGQWILSPLFLASCVTHEKNIGYRPGHYSRWLTYLAHLSEIETHIILVLRCRFMNVEYPFVKPLNCINAFHRPTASDLFMVLQVRRLG